MPPATCLAPSSDYIEQLPDPDVVRAQIKESVQRTELLRSILRLAKRKAEYRPSGQPCAGKGVSRGC